VKLTALGLFALAIMVQPSITVGAINPVLNYQGYLADSLGYPYPDGVHEITFSIYADSSGGVPLWTETQFLDLKRGLLHAYLGEIQPFPDSLFISYPLYLGVSYESA
jgi:hypothetical protein